MNDPTIAKPSGVLAWHSNFDHPDQVIDDPFLSRKQKREVLADWASDRCAVPDEPHLRRSQGGAIAPVADILAALRRLDGETPHPFATRPRRLRDILPYRNRLLFGEAIRVRRRRRRDDSDEPPPVPAAARDPQQRPASA